ncbi:conserved hypothetical protein [Trichinella spiralis]|uniref:hypothetical protein n=1 Tax=Trichinella spiralis TaxID=6334 RepID=UPI0001EFD52A|nr:conserved hypothetical protein [Trichinella spiralis]
MHFQKLPLMKFPLLHLLHFSHSRKKLHFPLQNFGRLFKKQAKNVHSIPPPCQDDILEKSLLTDLSTHRVHSSTRPLGVSTTRADLSKTGHSLIPQECLLSNQSIYQSAKRNAFTLYKQISETFSYSVIQFETDNFLNMQRKPMIRHHTGKQFTLE